MIVFHTRNLNHVTYKRLILRMLWELYGYDLKRATQFLDVVKIEIHPLSDTNTAYFAHLKTTSGQKINPNMPSGVAGKNHIRLFLHDNRLNSMGLRLRENAERIGHEICHEILFLKWGTAGGRHVTEVHDRADRGEKFTFWFYTLKTWWKIPITIIDIRRLL